MNEKVPSINQGKIDSNKEKNNKSKRSTFWKLSLAIPILLTLAGSPKEMKWNNRIDVEWCKIELAENLATPTDNDPEEIRSKEEMTKDYIGNNFYVNGTQSNNLKNVNIEKAWYNIYSVEFEHEFKEWPKKVVIKFLVEYKNNGIYFTYQNWNMPETITEDGEPKDLPINKFLEVDKKTHNLYDIRTQWNWKRIDFNIIYNEYRTKEKIKNIVRDQQFTPVKNFDNIDEFENTQLTQLNSPVLGKEVFEDWDWYYRMLFFHSINGQKIYFTPNWEFDTEKTGKITILGIDIDYEISPNNEFIISETSRQALEDKIRHDRKIIIEMLNGTLKNHIVANNKVFSGLNKVDKPGTFQFDSKIIILDLNSWTYAIKLSNEQDPIYGRVEGESFVLTDKPWKKLENVYFNHEARNKENSEYYKINNSNGSLLITKISTKIENSQEPVYTWDNNAINLLRKSGNFTIFDDGYLNYFNNEWFLIAKMPYDRQEDGSYKFNQEKYHTKIKTIDLFNYPWFTNKVQKINELAANLWITDADIRDIFEKSLINDWLDLEQNVIKITNPTTWKSIYYKLNQNNQIKLDKKLYGEAEKHIDFMLNRLKLAQIVNNSKVLWKNGTEYRDFEEFIGWEAWIGKQIISLEQLKAFISWESNEITVRIWRWSGNYTDIIFKASGKKLKARLKSGEWKWSVYLNPQRYYIKVDKNWNIIVDPKEEKR